MSSSLFCVFGDHPHRGDLSLGFRRYPVSAVHPQASAEAAQAAQSASCHSTRLCVSSGRRPSMNVLVPSGAGDLCYSAGPSV